MTQISKRPVNSRISTGDDDKEYKSRMIKLDVGGKDAPEGAWAGENIVPMRIVPRVTRWQGRVSASFALEGFDPDTGEPVILFFDPHLKPDGTYSRNFAGGLAEALGDSMSADEFYEVTQQLNEESGQDFNWDINMWMSIGGPIKLKPRFQGVPILIGKEAIKTKGSGTRMHVVTIDNPADTEGNTVEYDQDYINGLANNYAQEMWQPAPSNGSKARHAPTQTQEKPQSASSSHARVTKAAVKNESAFVPAAKKEPVDRGMEKLTAYERALIEQELADQKKAKVQTSDVTKGSNNGRNMFLKPEEKFEASAEVTQGKKYNGGREVVNRPTKPAGNARDVAGEFNRTIEKSIGNMPKQMQSSTVQEIDPEAVFEDVENYFEMGVPADQLVVRLVEKYDIPSDTAVAYLREFIRMRHETGTENDEPEEEPEGSANDIFDWAKSMKSQGFSVPQAFDKLGEQFPNTTKEERKDALRKAGML